MQNLVNRDKAIKLDKCIRASFAALKNPSAVAEATLAGYTVDDLRRLHKLIQGFSTNARKLELCRFLAVHYLNERKVNERENVQPGHIDENGNVWI